MNITVLVDRPHYKAGGNLPFIAPPNWPTWAAGWPGVSTTPPAPWNLAASRAAYRHGGALPWTLVREGKTTPRVSVNGGMATFVVGTITAPIGDAYYLLEKVGGAPTASNTYYAGEIAGSIRGAMNVTGGYNWKFLGNAESLYFLPNPPKIEEFAHPGHPVLSVGNVRAASGEVLLGLANEIGLVRAGATALNVRTLGSQVQYFFKLAGLGYTYSTLTPNPFPATFVPYPHQQYPIVYGGGGWVANEAEGSLAPRSTTGRYQMTAHIRNGWTYCANIDAETGKVTTITPVPEPSVVAASVLDTFQNDQGGEPSACAMTWNGARKIIASGDTGVFPTVYGFRSWISGPTPLGGSMGILRWRYANPWRFVMHVHRTGWAFGFPAIDAWEQGVGGGRFDNGVIDPLTFVQPQPFNMGGFGVRCNLFRGLRARDSNGSSTSGWNVLANFEFTGPTAQADGTIITQPAIGEEIIISGDCGYQVYPTFPPDYLPISFVLFPEASPTPVALGQALGGVLQGGAP